MDAYPANAFLVTVLKTVVLTAIALVFSTCQSLQAGVAQNLKKEQKLQISGFQGLYL